MEANTNSTELIKYPSDSDFDILLDRAKSTIISKIPPATTKAYTFDWKQFELFCAAQNRPSLPAQSDLVIAYMQSSHDKRIVATSISRALTAIRRAHKLCGLPDPTQWPQVRELMSGIRRAQAGRRKRQARPILWPQIVRLLAVTVTLANEKPRALRDACMFSLCWFGALRRSELVELKIGDVTDDYDGIAIRIPVSKTDPEGYGETVTIPFLDHSPIPQCIICPVQIFRDWRKYLMLKGINRPQDSLFYAFRKGDTWTGKPISDKAFCLILKQRLSLAGFDPDLYSAHSMRAGFATSAAIAGCEERKIQEQLRHKSAKTTRGYIRDGRMFGTDHPLFKIYDSPIS